MEDDKDSRRHKALQTLKPVCLAMMQECTKANVETFISSLSDVKSDVAQEIQQYILFPLQNTLHQKSIPESSLCAICQALHTVLEKTTVLATQTFFDLFNPILYHLSSPSCPSKVSIQSEETTAAVINCLSILIRSSTPGVLHDIYSLKCLPAFGQLFTLLLVVAEKEKSRSLQMTSMDCLMTVLQLGSDYGSTRRAVLGNLFGFCLPGISMALTRIITGDQKQGSEVIRKAMEVWRHMVCLVMADQLLDQAVNTKTQMTGSLQSVDKEKLASLVVERNEAWLQATASKLNILFADIRKLCSHGNWKVRMSLVELAEDLLAHCSRSLSKNIPQILESLVGLISDDYDKVAQKAFSVLQTFSENQALTSGDRSLTEILEDNIHQLATSLPRQIRMCDAEDKLPLINLLKGYITLLGPRVQCVVNSSCHLRHVALALVQALELDVSDSKILEERATLLDYDSNTFHGEGQHVWMPKKLFKHFRDDAILCGLLSVCQLLGRYGNVYILVDTFLELFHQSSVYKLASIFIINEIVLGAGKCGNSATETASVSFLGDAQTENDLSLVQDVITMLLEEYVLIVNLQDESSPPSQPPSSSLESLLTVAVPESKSSSVSIVNRNREILLSCLFMEGVGKFALVLGEKFGQHLIRTLYPLVENLGHENIRISSTAYTTLTQICSACGYRSIDDLLQENADYLISDLSIRLRHFSQNRRSPRLLSVMLRYCSAHILSLIDHSIGEILDSLDDHYEEDVILFVPVLQEVTSAICRWFPPTTPMSTKNKRPEKRAKSLVSELEEYARQKSIAEGDFTDEDVLGNSGTERTLDDIENDINRLKGEMEGSKNEDEEKDEEDEKRDSPKHVQIVKEILSRVKHLLSSQDARVRVQALEVVGQVCLDLTDHQRDLLPQIHQVWPGVSPRFHSEEKFVVIKALQTLMQMVTVSGNFMQQRVMKDVVPKLESFMAKQAAISLGSRLAYINSASFKLQLAVLETLGPLAEKLELDGNNLDAVARLCLPYLSDGQPVKLQEACVTAFSHFIIQDADAMWLLLCQVYCPRRYATPDPAFRPLHASFDPERENSYSKNVREIFASHFT